jgi:hypothetical protein
MSAQMKAMIYVYDVDGEGDCVMHFISTDGEQVAVMPGNCVYPPTFFKSQLAMHQRMGHTMTVEVDNELGTVYAVRVGSGNFWLLMSMLTNIIEGMIEGWENGGHHASQN